MGVTMKILQESCGNSVLLTEDHIYFGGMNLSYQLLVKNDPKMHRFYIRIQKSEEVTMAELGIDLYRAVRCYRQMVESTVTPCTLEEVLLELRYA